MVHSYQLNGFWTQKTNTVKLASIEQHLQETSIVCDCGKKPGTPGKTFARAVNIIAGAKIQLAAFFENPDAHGGKLLGNLCQPEVGTGGNPDFFSQIGDAIASVYHRPPFVNDHNSGARYCSLVVAKQVIDVLLPAQTARTTPDR